MKVKLYVEGGGDSRSLHINCREAFRKLLESAGFKGRMPATKACGGRAAAYDDFRTAVEIAGPDEYPILLVDSEAAVATGAWAHLQRRDRWKRPESAEEDQAQLMVQCMETWIVADRGTLRTVFGNDLREGALPADHDLESRPKDDVQQALEDATRECGRDRMYKKGKRSFQVVGKLDPARLRERLPHFDALCDTLERVLGPV